MKNDNELAEIMNDVHFEAVDDRLHSSMYCFECVRIALSIQRKEILEYLKEFEADWGVKPLTAFHKLKQQIEEEK